MHTTKKGQTGVPADAREAAWQLHLENLQLRAELERARDHDARKARRLATLEKQLAELQARVRNHNLYRKQVRRLVSR